MVNDPIGDMLIQIKNAALAKKGSVELPYSKLKKALADVLLAEGCRGTVGDYGCQKDK
ncbi:MAG: 30S ribosomal protein S8 [Microgenomates group bacterium GW2011_GWC1_49_7]|nr:MAG: 30S ribosomal protein S8 [Microgenomates group bacterium GW2011_GWC1_49_7]